MYLGAVLSVANTLFYAVPTLAGILWASVIFTVLAIIAGSNKISLGKGSGGVGAMSMSLGFTVTFAALLYCGPTAGMMVGVISCVAAGLRGKPAKAAPVAVQRLLVYSRDLSKRLRLLLARRT